MRKIVFACVQNAGRSQMAASFFNSLANPAKAAAISAGSHPAAQVHPEVVAVMREAGIDLSQATPRQLTDGLARDAQLLVTMGCGDVCPYVPGLKREDWAMQDPHGKSMEDVRAIRDEIQTRVEKLIAKQKLG